MTKLRNKNKKFSLDISLDQLEHKRSGFILDLRKNDSSVNEGKHQNKKTKRSNNYSWKSKRVSSSLSFFFKPLTHHRHGGMLLDKRAEEISDRLSSFEKKVFASSFLGRAIAFSLVLLSIFIPLKLLAYYKILDPQALKQKISASSHLAINDLMLAASAASRLDLKSASNDFSGAAQHFLQAEDDLKGINQNLLGLAALSGNKELRLAANGQKFLAAGILASSLGQHLSLALDGIFSQGDPKDSLAIFEREGAVALREAKSLSSKLEEIDAESLPSEYRQQFSDLKEKVNVLDDALSEAVPAASKLGELFGVNRDKRYLLIFQNNNELRGGGGFMGSYALIDFSGGKVKNLEIPGGGTYDTKGGLSAFVKSPEALRLIAARWFFWDANWFPDWALSADNIRWFYEKSGGPTVDGVIAFTPDIIDGLLEITGPIDLTSEYGVIIDANNFYEITQQITEKDNLVKDGQLSVDDFRGATSTTNIASATVLVKQDLERNQGKKPKKIIGDLTAKILSELPKKIDRENIAKILTLTERSLDQKQLMFNFSDPKLQAEVERRSWAGRQEKTTGDYLMVVDSNISGGKSDYRVTERIEQSTEIQADGRILNRVKITKNHSGIKNEKLFGMRNVDWLRIYVPLGSELIDSSGFTTPSSSLFKKAADDWQERPLIQKGEGQALKTRNGTMIYQENNKTVFANWLMVDPGNEASVEFSYYLPFRMTFSNSLPNESWQAKLGRLVFGEKEKLASYSLLVQKQPGAKAPEYYGKLSFPDSNKQLNNIWVYPEVEDAHPLGWEKSQLLEGDQSFGVIIKSNN
ncbi:MAG: DUF4012 domain-containing protein [Candidatus Falkowbacteria bacterium]|nr:DUF4012 domain-containing protein [Candidatus Falkowbacteria bacterium]